MFAVTELFNIAVNDIDGRKWACYSRVLVVTELVVSGTQCNSTFLCAYSIGKQYFMGEGAAVYFVG